MLVNVRALVCGSPKGTAYKNQGEGPPLIPPPHYRQLLLAGTPGGQPIQPEGRIFFSRALGTSHHSQAKGTGGFRSPRVPATLAHFSLVRTGWVVFRVSQELGKVEARGAL